MMAHTRYPVVVANNILFANISVKFGSLVYSVTTLHYNPNTVQNIYMLSMATTSTLYYTCYIANKCVTVTYTLYQLIVIWMY